MPQTSAMPLSAINPFAAALSGPPQAGQASQPNPLAMALLGNVNSKARFQTPQDIERAQLMAQQLQQEGTKYSPIGSWTQGVARLADTLVGDKQASDAGDAANNLRAQVAGQLSHGLGAGNGAANPLVQGLGGSTPPAPGSLAEGLGAGTPPTATGSQQASDLSGGDPTFGRMIGAESGGQQFGPNGAPLTSSAGAIGVAQVMPGTAPEAAQYAGLPYDENRYRNDPAYNAALGKAYYQHQVAQFGGDTSMAAAAYNAGPGAVQQAVAQARQGGGSYLDYLPAETQAYVAKVSGGGQQQASAGPMGSIGAPAGAAPSMPPGGALPPGSDAVPASAAMAYAPASGGGQPAPGNAMAALASSAPASTDPMGGNTPTTGAGAGVTNVAVSPAQLPTDRTPGAAGAAATGSLVGNGYPGQGDSPSMAAQGTQVAANTPQGGTLPFSLGQGQGGSPPASAQPQQNASDLMAVMMNPWASPAQQQIASQALQRLREAGHFTPYRDADGSLMQHDNFSNETKVLQDNHPKSPDVENYRLAKATGFQGSFGDYILGVKKAQAPLTQTNIDQRGEGAESAKSGEFAATRRNDMLIAADKAPENISRLQLMNKVLSDTQTGPLSGDKGKAIAIAGALGISPDTIKSLGFDPNQPVNNEIAQKLSNELVAGSIGAKGGGFPASNFSVAERQFIEKMFPNIQSQPGSNQAVSDVLIAREQRNLDKADAWSAYKTQQRGAGKPLSYEDFESNWQQGHGGDNIFAPIMQKYAAGGYAPAGAPLPSPTPFGTFGTQNTQQSTGYQGGALAAARDAIAKGAPRDRVIDRLKQSGVDATGL